MTAPTRATPRRKLGYFLEAAGIGAILVGWVLRLGNSTGEFPTFPWFEYVAWGLGVGLFSTGTGYVRGTPVRGGLEKRRTSVVVVIAALLLFGPMLLIAAFVFAKNFEGETSGAGWIASTVFLLVSLGIVSALVRNIVLRFDKT